MCHRIFAAAVFLSLGGATADAGFIMNFNGVAAAPGGLRFTYEGSVSDDIRIEGSGANQGFVTIYDFAGYVDGSALAPADWTFASAPIGKTPPLIAPQDNPITENLTWTYTGAAPIGSGLGGGTINLGVFSAVSSLSGLRLDDYSTQATSDVNDQAVRFASQTVVPSAVPEPSVVVLTGAAALLGLGFPRRKRSEKTPAA